MAQNDMQFLGRSLAGKKSHLTRKLKSAQEAIKLAQTEKSSSMAARLEKIITGIEESVDSIEQGAELYIPLIVDDDSRKLAQDDVDKFAKNGEDMILEIHKELKKLTAPAPALAAPPVTNTNSDKIKPNEALKPITLLKTFTPVELRTWIASFKAYHTSSHFEKATIPEQQAYLMQVLEPQLQSHVRSEIDTDTGIFKDPNEPSKLSCIKVLEDYFLLTYPLVARRFDFFSHKQAQGESFMDYAAKMCAKAEEVDITNLGKDDLIAYLLIAGTSNKKLKCKFLTLKEATLKNLRQEAHAFESTQNNLSSMGENTTKAQQIKGFKPKFNPKSKQGPYQGQNSEKCSHCGKTNHKSSDCYKKDVKCKHCSKFHLDYMCKQHQPRSRSASSKRGPNSAGKSNATNAVYTKSVKDVAQPTPRMEIVVEGEGAKSFGFSSTPDSGTTRTLFALNLIQKAGLKYNKQGRERIFAANDNQMSCEGNIVVKMTTQGVTTTVDALVTSDLHDEILVSWGDLKKLRVLPQNFPNVIKENKTAQMQIAASDPNAPDSLEKIKLEFADVLSDKLNGSVMKGEPMKIHLTKGPITPKKTLTAKQTELHLQAAAAKAVDEFVREGIIEPVDTPTDWCSPGFFVPKEQSDPKAEPKVRLVTNFTHLNKHVQRPVHPFPSARDIVSNIPADSKFFAKLDAVHGYFQIELEEESSKLTTFILPTGRFKYRRAPMGLVSSSDEWCRRSDAAIKGIEGVQKIVDDILIYGPTKESVLAKMRQVLERCREHQITISHKKLKVGTEVKFAGFLVSDKGVKPDPEKLAAIADFPAPENVTGVRSFLGLANQLGQFLPDLAQMTHKMRELLKKGIAFQWLPDHQKEFEHAKKQLTSDMLVKYFDPGLPTELLTDASKLEGLGYALVQREPNGKIRLIQCGSRSLNSAEKNYATIELECLAIQWAIEKSRHYLIGLPNFTVITDHNPLVGIFKKELDAMLNKRLQRIRLKLMDYCFNVTWVPGKTHEIADALSRSPVFFPADNAAKTCFVSTDLNLNALIAKAKTDTDYLAVVNALRADKSLKDLPSTHPARLYSSVWKQLSLLDQNEETLILFNSDRIVIPKVARKEILDLLHKAHTGIVKTRKQAQQLYYWPQINADIKTMIESCNECQALLPSQPAEPLQQTTASFPMEKVSMDLFYEKGQHYLIMADRYSGYPFVSRLSKETTSVVTAKLSDWFCDLGRPTSIRADGGPQFRQPFKEFCRKLGIDVETSSPNYPQSNGHAESGVKEVKRLLIKIGALNDEFKEALQELRNTPRADGFSPAQMFLGRRQRSSLPTLPSALAPIDHQAAQEARKETRDSRKVRFDQTTKPLKPIIANQKVRVQDPKSKRWTQSGLVVKTLNGGRRVLVRFDEGGERIRNRRFIRPQN